MRNDLHTLIENNDLDSKSPLFEEVVLYLLRTHGTAIKVYHKRFAQATAFEGDLTPARFRADLHDTEYVGVALKFFAGYTALIYDRVSKRHLRTVATRFNLTERDGDRVIAMMSSRNTRTVVRDRLIAAGHTQDTLSLAAYRDALQLGHGIVIGLKDSIAKHVCRKLTWVARAHNCRPSDLNTEITAQVISVYYSMLPTVKSADHVHGYLCSALHSRINNLCNYHSADKRKRQVQVKEYGQIRYSLIEASESHLNRYGTGADTELSIENLAGCDDSLELHNFEFTRSVKSLFQKVKRGSKRFALYSVLLGRDVPAFAEFLRQKRLLRSETKTVKEWLINKSVPYLAEVFSKWLGTSVNAVHKGMTDMAMILL